MSPKFGCITNEAPPQTDEAHDSSLMILPPMILQIFGLKNHGGKNHV